MFFTQTVVEGGEGEEAKRMVLMAFVVVVARIGSEERGLLAEYERTAD